MYTYGITGASINEFGDVTITSVVDGQILQYNSTTAQWENVAPSGGASALDDLTDVVVTAPAEYQTLEYNGTNWVNKHSSVVTYVRNDEAVTMNVGDVVYLSGATGDHANVKFADNTSDTTSSKTVGIVAGAAIAPGQNGTVVTRGYVDGVDLNPGYSPGDILWLGTNGAFTTTKPTAPAHLVFVGVAVRCTNNGIVYVATQNGYELDELHNVKINGTLADNDILRYDAATDLWKNETWQEPSQSFQTPVNTRKYLPLGVQLAGVTGFNVSNCAAITFKDACNITALSIYQTATYSGATTYDYRLGVYGDNNGVPGSLLVDAGTLSIATGATAGFKTITLGSPLAITAGQRVWLIVCGGGVGTVPTIYSYSGHTQPYANYGLSGANATQACCFTYTAAASTAFPATFTLAAVETQPIGMAVYATVSV